VRRHIRCVSVLSAAQVRQWPGVDAVSERDSRLDIEARIAEPIVQRLLMSDPSLSELEVTRAGLAEAFVQITKGPMRASDELERAVPAHGEAA
jgi:ABC-2 type transport system ATP-binding protein